MIFRKAPWFPEYYPGWIRFGKCDLFSSILYDLFASIYQEGSWFMNGWWVQKEVFPIVVLQREETTGWWTLCSPNHFAPWNTLHPNSLCISTHFTPWHTLLLSTLWNSAYFDHQHTLITWALCSMKHFALWNTLLPRTLYFLEHFALSVPGSKGCWGGQFTN